MRQRGGERRAAPSGGMEPRIGVRRERAERRGGSAAPARPCPRKPRANPAQAPRSAARPRLRATEVGGRGRCGLGGLRISPRGAGKGREGGKQRGSAGPPGGYLGVHGAPPSRGGAPLGEGVVCRCGVGLPSSCKVSGAPPHGEGPQTKRRAASWCEPGPAGRSPTGQGSESPVPALAGFSRLPLGPGMILGLSSPPPIGWGRGIIMITS